jgi:hypothetical protein
MVRFFVIDVFTPYIQIPKNLTKKPLRNIIKVRLNILFIISILLMKKHLHKTSNFPRYALLFLLGVSAVYFASAYTDINTALINATQYIQKIILTNDGNQSGITGIVLD